MSCSLSRVGNQSSQLLTTFIVSLVLFCLQKVGFFNQQYADQLNMDETATEYLMRNFNLPCQDSRKCLGRFGLESHAHTIQISKLSGRTHRIFERKIWLHASIFVSAPAEKSQCSPLPPHLPPTCGPDSNMFWCLFDTGGQKARVVFAELSCRQPDVLILVRPAGCSSLLDALILTPACLFLTGWTDQQSGYWVHWCFISSNQRLPGR